MRWNAINGALALVGLALFFHAVHIDLLYKLSLGAVFFNTLWLSFGKFGPSETISTSAIAPAAAAIAAYPLALAAISALAGVSPFTKNVYHVFLYACIPLSLQLACCKSKFNHEDLPRIVQTTAILIIGFAAIEALATFLLSKENGTLRNPHYLAQYCMLLLIVGLYLAFQTRFRAPRKLLFASLGGLGALLIHTWSRPAWIALVASGLISLFLVRRKIGWRTPTVLALVIAVIYAFNIGAARTRIDDLILNITHEERVTIWRDAGNMQLSSSPRQWLVGHGIDSFYENFKAYSEFRVMDGENFKTPHNFFIELLYTMGIMGLLASIALILTIYMRLYRQYKRGDASSYIAMLIAVLTANIFFTSITVSFFASYNLLIVASVAGLLIVHEKLFSTDNADHPKL